ncbi:CsgG/HfaB family protein [Asticcacaulis benevestitus]|uniref:Curli production assembly/transport component CsgG n=1 Tax=Asticcacaulis benevestitus DSM 16100 = ATCC BAA-896 TaxID=1121022 RepID=V4PKD3_9CAUL|nr:CsgG/HfaB family protein [Asticcacaulis benevestitus]ESQ88671.1 hypothetical protein ABENE_15630 [Asticcacaulis benevestitus DSM 16100 = ATCC BAA-896]
MKNAISKRTFLIAGTSLLTLQVAACSPKKDDASKSAEKLREEPDFGGVKEVYVEAEGRGGTPEEAIDNAILNAAKQVNGAQTESLSENLKVAGTISVGNQSIDYSGQRFTDLVATRSGGVITQFKIIEAPKEGFAFPGGDTSSKWRVRIGANVAKYQASADSKRPRVIVATPRSSTGSYALGNGSRSAEEVGNAIREQINTSLSQTNRFTVLDTSVARELDAEADRLASGNVNATDTARLGQRLAADLLIIPTIERMEYIRSSRQLRMADRELVSYSGGATLAFKVVNATTGQLVLSERYSNGFPSTEPTTLGARVDGLSASAKSIGEMTQKFVAALMQKTFPLSVIKLDGADVVIGQGGSLVRSGNRYRAVLLGDMMKDPQTGQNLGRTESDFGTVVITRVDTNLSYGRLENAPALSQAFQPGLVELRDSVGVTAPETAQGGDATPAVKPRNSSKAAPSQSTNSEHPVPAAPSKSSDKDW